MKFKIRDVVKVRSDLICGTPYNDIYFIEKMLELKGKVVHIAEIFEDSYHILEDNRRLFWNDEMFEPLTEEEIKKHLEEYVKGFNDYDIKVEIKKKEPILDEEEKKYLSAVIRPFRDRVKYIAKIYAVDYQFICIYVECIAKDYSDETVYLPFFKENTMYKGMVQNKEYTLDELGI